MNMCIKGSNPRLTLLVLSDKLSLFPVALAPGVGKGIFPQSVHYDYV